MQQFDGLAVVTPLMPSLLSTSARTFISDFLGDDTQLMFRMAELFEKYHIALPSI